MIEISKRDKKLIELFSKMHIKYKNYPQSIEPDIVHASSIRLETQWEEILAENSGGLYKHKPGKHQDFDNGDDAKLASMASVSKIGGPEAWALRITGTKGKGALRICGYNHIDDKLHFFYIPSWSVKKFTRKCDDSYRIAFTMKTKTFFLPEERGIIEFDCPYELAKFSC